MVDAVDVPVIASGGVGALQDLVDGIKEGGADAVLAASIFHYGEFTMGQAKAAMAAAGRDAGEVVTRCARERLDFSRWLRDVKTWLDEVRWNSDGLVAAIAQDAARTRC